MKQRRFWRRERSHISAEPFRCDKSLMEGVAVSTDFSLKARENLH